MNASITIRQLETYIKGIETMLECIKEHYPDDEMIVRKYGKNRLEDSLFIHYKLITIKELMLYHIIIIDAREKLDFLTIKLHKERELAHYSIALLKKATGRAKSRTILSERMYVSNPYKELPHRNKDTN